MGRVGSGPEFQVNFGLGRVGSLHLWVGLGRVKKIGPTSNSVLACIIAVYLNTIKYLSIRNRTQGARSTQEAQLSQRGRAMFRVIEYFAESLKSFEMTPFDRSYTSSYRRSMVTMAQSGIIS